MTTPLDELFAIITVHDLPTATHLLAYADTLEELLDEARAAHPDVEIESRLVTNEEAHSALSGLLNQLSDVSNVQNSVEVMIRRLQLYPHEFRDLYKSIYEDIDDADIPSTKQVYRDLKALRKALRPYKEFLTQSLKTTTFVAYEISGIA